MCHGMWNSVVCKTCPVFKLKVLLFSLKECCVFANFHFLDLPGIWLLDSVGFMAELMESFE